MSKPVTLSILMWITAAAILIGIQFGWLMGVTAFVTIVALKSRVPSYIRPYHVKVVKDE